MFKNKGVLFFIFLSAPATAGVFPNGILRDHGHTGPGDGGLLHTSTVTAQNLLKIGGISLTPGSLVQGPGGNSFNGGILTQSVTANGPYQVDAYQISPTTGTAPDWGPITENVWQRTSDQSTNFQRISLTAMAAWAGPGLNDEANDYRLQQEASGTSPVLPLKFTAQHNSSGGLVEYETFNSTYSASSTSNSVAQTVDFFRRIDPPFSTGNNWGLSVGQLWSATSKVLTSAGQQDSPYINIFGNAYDTSLHQADWKIYADVTSNAGASALTFYNRIDGAAYAQKFAFDDQGAATFYTNAGNNVTFQTGGVNTLVVGGTAVGSSYPITIGSANIVFSTASMGNLGSVYYLARGGGSTLGLNVPTSANFQLMVNNVLVGNWNGSGLQVTGSITASSHTVINAATTGGQAVTSGNTNLLTETETIDRNGEFTTSSFTVTIAGYYLISGKADTATTAGTGCILFRKNGSAISGATSCSPTIGADLSLSLTWVENLVVNDVIDMSGSAASDTMTFSNKVLTITRLP